MTKKEKEKHILDMVYDEERVGRVEESERPDFLLTLPGCLKKVGVEITEFYFTESDARVRNISSYTEELIDHGAYRHKDDKEILHIGEISITRPDDDSFSIETDAVIRDNLPSTDDYASMIAERIWQKGAKHDAYCDGLSHVNLVVYDGENRLSFVEPSDFHKYFYTRPLKEALLETPFHELFIVTRLAKNRRVYYPLKSILLLSELHIFGHALEQYDATPSEISLSLSLRLFALFMRRRGGEVYVHEKTDGEVIVLFGDSSVTVNEKGTTLHLHENRPFSVPLDVPAAKIGDGLIDERFLAHFETVEETAYFTSRICFDAHSDVLLES